MISLDTFTLLAPAFMVGAMISLAHVPLGQEVLKRGIIFLDLAVAQFAALGMIAFHVYFDNEMMDPRNAEIYSLFCGLGLALACAIGLNKIEKHAKNYQEAIIGSAFICAASLTILIMSGDPHGGDEMKNILAGQILWVTWEKVFYFAPLFLCIAMIWMYSKRQNGYLFYILFAVTIPFSVSLIGVYLVFASLILPALATTNEYKYRFLKGYSVSVIAFSLGLILSYYIDGPASPTIVIAMALIASGYKLYNNQKQRGKSSID